MSYTIPTQPSSSQSILSSINLNSLTFLKNQDLTSSTSILFDSLFRSKDSQTTQLFRSRSTNKENLMRENMKIRKTLVKKENLKEKGGLFLKEKGRERERQRERTNERDFKRNPTTKVVPHITQKIVIDLRNQRNERGLSSSSSLSKSQSSIFSSTKLTSFNFFNSLNNSSINDFKTISSRIRVFSRIKPDPSSFFNLPGCQLIDNKIKMQGCLFHLDNVFTPLSTQQQIFQEVGVKSINQVLQGYNSTIFVYGQTGSGKTYTMFGGQSGKEQGIIPRAITEVFRRVRENEGMKYSVKVSMLEIYKENLADLLGVEGSCVDLKIKEGGNGLVIENLNEIEMSNEKELNLLIEKGHQGRKVASTRLNQHSSRSHTIIILNIQSLSSCGKLRRGKLYLVDLAGSEKVSKSGAQGDTLQQAKKINLSLSCLGNVINALISRSKREHIPYRDSKLTRVLQQSLGGNCITSIIVNMSQRVDCYDESLSTLKFAERVSRIKKTVASNRQAGGRQEVGKLHEIIASLQNQLKYTKEELSKYKSFTSPTTHNTSINITTPTSNPNFPDSLSDNLTARCAIPSERANVQQKLQNYSTLRNKKIPKMKLQLNLNDLSILNTTNNDDRLNSSLISPSLSSLSFNKSPGLSRDNSLNFSIKPEEQRILGELDQSWKSVSRKSGSSEDGGSLKEQLKQIL